MVYYIISSPSQEIIPGKQNRLISTRGRKPQDKNLRRREGQRTVKYIFFHGNFERLNFFVEYLLEYVHNHASHYFVKLPSAFRESILTGVTYFSVAPYRGKLSHRTGYLLAWETEYIYPCLVATSVVQTVCGVNIVLTRRREVIVRIYPRANLFPVGWTLAVVFAPCQTPRFSREFAPSLRRWMILIVAS